MSKSRFMTVAAMLSAAVASPAVAGTLTGDCDGWNVAATSNFSFPFTISVTASLVDANTNVVISTSSDSTSLPAGGGPWKVTNTWPDPVPTGNYIIEAIEVITNDSNGNVVLTNNLVFPETGALACVGTAEGCTPGYWKQPHHFDDWPAPYTPGTLFSAVFDNAFPGKTLLTVLSQPGSAPPGPNQLNALGRHTVAALLNGASDDVNYPFTDAEVIAQFNLTYPGSDDDYVALKNVFADANEAGCPFNNDADVDGDGLVGFSDLIAVLAAWGTWQVAPDVDHSGMVGFGDLLEVLSWWNS